MNSFISTSVTTLKGIGASRQQTLSRLGIETLWDLLLHLPFRYEDRSTITPISLLRARQSTVVQGLIDKCTTTRGRKPRFDCYISDSTGSIVLRFFNYYPGQQLRFASGQKIRCFGRVSYGQDGLELIHPECEIITASKDFEQLPQHLSPVYPLTQGLSQQVLRQAVTEALEKLRQCEVPTEEWITPASPEYHQLSIDQVLSTMHFPDIALSRQWLGPELNNLSQHPARKRLALEELLIHGQHARRTNQSCPSQAICNMTEVLARTEIDNFLQTLDFEPTAAQTRVINEIIKDLSSQYAMRRLLQGDVGSGKTLVAACAALPVLHTGAQVAILAPTELLAEQHFLTFNDWFSPVKNINIKLVLMKGGQNLAMRQQLLDSIQSGSATLVIGTHAILQDNVVFQKLGLIVIDEQHRFGVEQRASLMRNNLIGKQCPHQLIMTATPIPRTLALLQYADVNVSRLDELPSGRVPVTTVVMSKQRRQDVIQRIQDWVAQGKQVYWVCTIIEDNEQSSRDALHVIHATLCAELPAVRIEMLHGKLSAQEKQTVMTRFREHEFDVLVATTVIEVGVDVSNANLMVIEDADHLGLAQLHQLRGRVGRGNEQGYCVLLYQPPLSDIAKQRLGLLRECHDGFEIAEKDLELRGPGEIAGLRQSGSVCFKVADLAHDHELIELSQQILEQLENEGIQISQDIQRRWISSHNHTSRIEV